MSIQSILTSLENLVHVHGELLAISEQKTEIVKEGSVEKLQNVLLKERKVIQELEQAEANRKKEVDTWFTEKSLPREDATITTMLDLITDERDKQELERVTTELTQLILKLKQQEQLNQALIQQSMQFVHLSLDLLNPSIKNVNYGKNQTQDSESVKRSVFDSKA